MFTFACMNLPADFIAQIEALVPTQAADMLHAIAAVGPSVAVRVNDGRALLRGVPAGAQRVPWCEQWGFYLDERQAFTFDPDWHAGDYYVQDASSMFVAHVVRSLIGQPVRYLDLCAAPGGKTTAALQALPAGSLMVANEVVAQRARTLADNMVRWGHPDVVVTSLAAAEWGQRAGQWFDVVAVDAPCSGEGMMRKDAVAVEQWSPRLVEQCAHLQRQIVQDVWPALRSGGLLIYSTCTYNRQENEAVVDHLISALGAEAVAVPVDACWHVEGAIGASWPAYRFLPHRVRGEGLFVAVLRKPDAAVAVDALRSKGRAAATTQADGRVGGWLVDADNYVIERRQGAITAIRQAHLQDVSLLRSIAHPLYVGVGLATEVGHKLIPQHSLAMSQALSPHAFARCEVDIATAWCYLRGESISIDAPRGYVLITHRGAVLGFVNNLGQRANNLYPKPLRIMSTHLPDEVPLVLA